MRKLYATPLSGNCHKVRLLLSMLGLKYEEVPVDTAGGENRGPEFLKLNPLGQVPVLLEDEVRLRDSQAILIYLARRYGGEDWLPSDAREMGLVAQWLSYAANEIAHGPALARAHYLFGRDADLDLAIHRSHNVLEILDERLTTHQWLELDRPTIADLACFPYVGLAPQGHVPLDGCPHVMAWIGRVRALPGYVSMPGL